MANKPKERPNLRQLRAAAVMEAAKSGDLRFVERVDDLEQKVVRLIQIQDERKALEAERGYTDEGTDKRHPGLVDQLELLFMRYNLFDGVEIEDYIIYPHAGTAEWVDPVELLRLGVSDTIIKQATRKKEWSTIMARRLERKNKK